MSHPGAPPPLGALAQGKGEPIQGTVERVVYSNETSAWCVVRFVAIDGRLITAVGPLLGVRRGDRLRLVGRWVQHQRFGEQLEVESFVQIHPSTLNGIRKFLASGRIKGLGPALAERLVELFGLQTLEVLDREPERLTEVRGIGARLAERIREGWQGVRGLQQVMVFLHTHDVSPSIAVKVHKRYGGTAIDVVRENPYRLADEIFGVGFLTADRIARSLDIPQDAPQRLEAGLLFSLQQSAQDGHVFLPAGALLEGAAELLDVEQTSLQPALERLSKSGAVIVEEGPAVEAVYQPRLFEAETTVVARLGELRAAPAAGLDLDPGRALIWFERTSGMELADAQRKALSTALTETVTVITGGPGTGKTTLIRGLTSILERKGRSVLLAAPTGRAAKRLSEATGMPARTIHRLLEYNPVDHIFGRDLDAPLKADLLVVDEASMLDVSLAAALLRAVPPGCRLLLVGDADQLPSVGPGNVLADLIQSGIFPVVRLRHIFRQARESLIVVNAHRINQGRMPLLRAGEELEDFYFISREDPAAAAATCLEMVCRRIPQRFGVHPVDDIQVLSPMHRGELGVVALNQNLQAALNPDGPELAIGARRYRVGDKVMQVRNNYELDIFNGDLGRVLNVDREERQVVVSFDGRPVVLSENDLDHLVPAWACTIHKSQGSEYPAVVVLLHHQHHIMLQRNLLYTAITRGKRLVVVIGSRRALGRAVGNATVRRRHTLLAERLGGWRATS